jgi:hypothetical protein
MDPFLNILHPNGTRLSKKSLQSLQSARNRLLYPVNDVQGV